MTEEQALELARLVNTMQDRAEEAARLVAAADDARKLADEAHDLYTEASHEASAYFENFGIWVKRPN